MKSVIVRHALTALALVSLPLGGEAGAQQGGSIQGHVTLGVGPTRLTASRYPAGSVGTRQMQSVAAVAYLVGEGLETDPVAGSVDVVQQDTAFAPAALAVQTGTVVRFPNADTFFHNVFSYSRNARFDLGRYPEGDSREFAFSEPGIARLYCEVHEFMRAVIVVTDHPFNAVVADDGTFRMNGVPEGQYTIAVYHPDLGSVEVPVVVSSGETVEVRLAIGD